MGKTALTSSLFVLLAAFFWGLIGVFVKGIGQAGLDELEIVTVRVLFSALILFMIGMASFRQELKIKWKDCYLFIGTGLLSIAFFNWAFFTAINMLSLSVAVILLYTAPAFVMVMSVLFLKEKLTLGKIGLLAMTLIGCLLVAGSGGLVGGGGKLGYVIGLGAGFGYALYSIFGKFALKRYSPFTISFYTFFVASLVLVPSVRIWEVLPRLLNVEMVMFIIGLCGLSTVLAFLLYTEGLKGIESSKASILSTVEPLTAMLIGILFFGDRISAVQLVGGVIICFSAMAASFDKGLSWPRKTGINKEKDHSVNG
ncbi:DMT family transporter [Bacillus testis]|uniref:DMT family transporter n=1 Tax=Bacillus testis TaxID=1622072 RepID=UPI0008411CC4|nr:EamA family transporter [Bacillus testis]